jgi:hypothetical protein
MSDKRKTVEPAGEPVEIIYGTILKVSARRRGRRNWADDGTAYVDRVARCREALAKEKDCDVEAVLVIDACQRLIDENPDEFVSKKGGKMKAHSLRNRINEVRKRHGPTE